MKSNHESYKQVVKRLAQYREELGISQIEMGRYLDVTQSHYQKLEKGMKIISKRSLLAFENAGKDVFWLLTGKKSNRGCLETYLEAFDSTEKKQKLLQAIIWATEEGTRISRSEYDGSLNKAYELMKITDLDESFIWKQIRRVEDLTQQEMADILDINIKRYRKIEKGQIEEDAEILVSLYENLNYSPMLILNRERYGVDELNRIWNKFEASLLERLLGYVEYCLEILRDGKEE